MAALASVGPGAGRSAAQSVTGTVVRPDGADSVAVPGVRVVLHRVAPNAQGPVDSTVSGARGRFKLRYAPDTAALHLLSARYSGIEYFSSPLSSDPATADSAVRLVVHDTSSVATIGVATRHVVVPRAGEDGAREVLDLITLTNPGMLTRVAPDSSGFTWSGPLPAATEGLEVGESDVSPDAVERRSDSVIVSAPIAPGEKQLALQYHLPAGRRELDIPVGAGSVAFNLLLEEPAASASAPGLALADSQLIEGRAFRRWTGELPAGTRVRVRFPGGDLRSGPILAALVSAVALALAFAAWRALPRTQVVAADPLVGAIAALDARYQGREAETAAGEWSEYLSRRSRLKAELEAALARESGRR